MPNQTTHVYNIMLHLLLRNFKTSTQCVFTQDQVLPTAPEATTATATVSTSVPSEQPHAISGTIPQDDRIGNVTNSVSSGDGGSSGGGVERPSGQPRGHGVMEDDQQILKQHELALQRLEELQNEMIGGEKGGRRLHNMYMYIYMCLYSVVYIHCMATSCCILVRVCTIVSNPSE